MAYFMKVHYSSAKDVLPEAYSIVFVQDFKHAKCTNAKLAYTIFHYEYLVQINGKMPLQNQSDYIKYKVSWYYSIINQFP